MMIKGIKSRIKFLLNNEYSRRNWIEKQLKNINEGASILDAGCGSQQYKKYCSQLDYFAQDFGQYEKDIKTLLRQRKKITFMVIWTMLVIYGK